MYRIGIFDDEKQQCDLIEEKFELYSLKYNEEFEVFKSLNFKLEDREKDKEAVIEWILNERLDAIIMDFKTLGEYSFSGVELINYINTILIGFPCILLTAWKEEVKDLALVADYLIYDKSEVLSESIGTPEMKIFIEKLVNQINVFKNQLKINEGKYKNLFKEYTEGTITVARKNELEALHKILVAYDIIEDIPVDSNIVKIEKELEDLISKIESNL